MTTFSLLIRNLRFFRAANLAVMAGMVVATAVLTGALMVGDSVRGSLRTLAEQRLGPIDYALVSGRFFDQTQAERITQSPGFSDKFEPVVAGISLQGGIANDTTATRASGVQISAIAGSWVPVPASHAIINGELAGLIGIDQPNETVSINLPAVDDPFRDATLARRSRTDTTRSLVRVSVAKIVSDPGITSLFSLTGGQRTPKNVWVDLPSLQRAIDQSGNVNLLLVAGKPSSDAKAVDELNRHVAGAIRIGDYGLKLTKSAAGNETTLGSVDTYLMPPIVDAADKAAAKLNIPLRHVSTYLINTAADLAGRDAPKELHYPIAAGIDSLDDGPIAADEIVLNQYAADHLNAKVGDRIRLDYLKRQTNGDLTEVRSDRAGLGLTFRVGRILPMTGQRADPLLAPQYKGLTDKRSMSDWPDDIIKLNHAWVTKDDDAYWAKYKAAPKLFLNLDTARKLWGGTFGDLTGIRLASDKAAVFEDELRRTIDPAAMGMVFRPIKQEQLAAASGSTDFAMLFVSFSFFLILSAVLLVGMLFRLNIEQRSRQLGLLAAIGFRPRQLRRLALAEGLLVAVTGALIGTLAAIGYTWLMVAGPAELVG